MGPDAPDGARPRAFTGDARRVSPAGMVAHDEAPRGRATLLWAALVFLGALPLLWFRAQHLKEWEDEGYFANGALRVLDGQVVYRDFQHNYPPGRVWILALGVAVFGQHLWVVRSLWVLLQAGAAAMGLCVARRAMPLGFALAAAATIALNTSWMNKSAELFLGAAIPWILLRAWEGRTGDLAAGALFALCGHLRHDVAAFGMLVFPLALALRVLAGHEPGAPGLGRAILRRLVAAWRMPLGAALATLPLLIYLVANGALRVAVRDLLFSGYIANKLLPRPFPPLFESWSAAGLREALASTNLLFWIPVATYALGLAVGLARLRGSGRRASGAWALVVTAFGALCFLQVLPRSDIGHLSKAYVPVHLVGMFLVYVAWSRTARLALARRVAAASASLAGALFVTAMPLVHLWRLGVELPNSVPSLLREQDRYVDVDLPCGRMRILRGPTLKYVPLFERMAPYAGRPGEWLVVFPAGALLNFVLDLPNPLRYDLLRPGEMAGQQFEGELVPNHPRALAEVIARLDETRPRFLLDSSEATNEELRALLRRWAVQHGYTEEVGGRFRLWVRPG
jgi:hypothetical protein